MSDDSVASEGDLHNDVGAPTLDGQLVDVATAAIEKIKRKAAVAQGSWMKWFAPGSADASEDIFEKSEIAKSTRESVNGASSSDATNKPASATSISAVGDFIPTGPALQHSSSSPGYIVSSSSAYTSPHTSSRGSRASSIKCQSPAAISPPLEPHHWEQQDDDLSMSPSALTPFPQQRQQNSSTISAGSAGKSPSARMSSEGESSSKSPARNQVKLSTEAEAVTSAGRTMARKLRETVTKLAAREPPSREPPSRDQATTPESDGPGTLNLNSKPKSSGASDTASTASGPGACDTGIHPGPLLVLGGTAVTLRRQDAAKSQTEEAHGSSQHGPGSTSLSNLKDWLGSIGVPQPGPPPATGAQSVGQGATGTAREQVGRGSGLGLGLEIDVDAIARGGGVAEAGSGKGGASSDGPLGPDAAGSAHSVRTPSPHAAPSGAAWTSTLEMSVEDLVGTARDRFHRRMEKMMAAVSPHVDAVKDALGMAGQGLGGIEGRGGRCVRTVVTQMGHSYQGEFKDGLMDGYGRLEWPDGHWYQGEFRGGETCGVGRRVWGGGLAFVGEEVNGRKSGTGVMTWPDGRRYEGEFAGDVKEGVGLMVWAGGEWYLGGWRGGVRHGEGVEGGPGVAPLEVRYEAGKCVWGEAMEGLEAEEWGVAEWMRALLWGGGVEEMQGGDDNATEGPDGAADQDGGRSGSTGATPNKTGRRRGSQRKVARHGGEQRESEEERGEEAEAVEGEVEAEAEAEEKGEGKGKKGERVRCVLQVVNGEIWSVPAGMAGNEGGGEAEVLVEKGKGKKRAAREGGGSWADMPREGGEEVGGVGGDFVEEEGDCAPGGVGGGELVVESSWDEWVEEGEGGRPPPQLEHSLSSDSILSSSSSSSDRTPQRGGSWKEGAGAGVGGRVRLRDRMLEMMQGGSLTEMVEEDREGEALTRGGGFGLAERLVAKSHRTAQGAKQCPTPPKSPASPPPSLWDRKVPTPPASSPAALPSFKPPPLPPSSDPSAPSQADLDLWKAAVAGSGERVRAAVGAGGRVGLRDDKDRGNSALHKAAGVGQVEAVSALLGSGAEVGGKNKYGDSALHCAAFAGHLKVVEKLVEAGADVNASSEDGETAMHCAAYGGHAAVCTALASKGGRVNVASSAEGDTPLHMAALGGHQETVLVLLGVGADPLVANKEGQLPRELADLQGWHAVAATLHEAALPSCSL